MVVIERGHFEDGVKCLPSFCFSSNNSARYVLDKFISNDCNVFAVHLAFQFLNMVFLHPYLDSSVIHLRY